MAQSGLGAALRRAREAQGLSLEDAERDTRISKRYLDALENERFEVVPAPVYARGFLRSYSQYLGLDPNEVLSLFPKEEEPPPPQRGLGRNGGAARPPLGGGTQPIRTSRPRAPMLESDQRQSIMWAVIALGGVLFIVIIAVLIARAGDDGEPGFAGVPGTTLEDSESAEDASGDGSEAPIGGETVTGEDEVGGESGDGGGAVTDGTEEGTGDGGAAVTDGLVPDVRGMPIDDALAVLDEAGYQPLLFHDESVDPDNAVVQDQSPAPDTPVEPGGVVSLILRAP